MQPITCRMKPHVALKIIIFNTICIVLVTYLSSSPNYADNNATVISSGRTGSKYDEIHETLKKLNRTEVEEALKEKIKDETYGSSMTKEIQEDLLNTNPEYKRRLLQAYDHCLGRPPGVAKRVMVDKRKTSAMCIVPKVGSTHWINVFRFLNNETGSFVYRKPEDIPRIITHYAYKSEEYKLFPNFRNNVDYFRNVSFLEDSFRFMFVRHPIQRLCSAWVDKFLLPDFWFTEGNNVKYLKLTAKNDECPTNITFHEFLRFVTHPYYRNRPGVANEHWTPMEYQCDPCVFYPHLIGKMETFGEDSKVAISIMNTESHLAEETRKRSNQTGTKTKTKRGRSAKKNKDGADGVWLNTSYHGDRAVHEMRMLTDYNIDVLIGRAFRQRQKDCKVSELLVSKRLWKAFQYNGYIKSDIAFPMKNWNRHDWHKALLQAYSAWPDDKGIRAKQQKSQKENVVRTMYKNIPQDLLSEIHKMFKNDFSQFGYAFEPYTD